MLISKLKSESRLDSRFLATLPTECDKCGAELEITDTLTAVMCPNSGCRGKLVSRLQSMLRDLGIKDFGESRCEKFFDTHGHESPYAFLFYNPDMHGVIYEGASMSFSESVFESISPALEGLKLWEFVRAGNFKGIRDSAHSLFNGYSSIDDFYTDFSVNPSGFVSSRLGVSEGVSTKVLQVVDTLMSHQDELLEYGRLMDFTSDIDDAGIEEVNICISRAVGGGLTKDAFVKKLNEMYKGRVSFRLQDSVTSATDFLIWSGELPETSKIKATNAKNKKAIIKYLESDFMVGVSLVHLGIVSKSDITSKYDEYYDKLDMDEMVEYAGVIPVFDRVGFEAFAESKWG